MTRGTSTSRGCRCPRTLPATRRIPTITRTRRSNPLADLNPSPIFDINAKDAPDFTADLLTYGKKNNLENISFNDVGFVNQEQPFYLNQSPHPGTNRFSEKCGETN